MFAFSATPDEVLSESAQAWTGVRERYDSPGNLFWSPRFAASAAEAFNMQIDKRVSRACSMEAA